MAKSKVLRNQKSKASQNPKPRQPETTRLKAPENDYVKKSTMVTVAVVALALGFFGGIVLSVYKTGNTISASAPMNTAQQQPFAANSPLDQSSLIKTLVDATAENPDNFRAWVELGNTYFDTGQPANAIQAYEKALALNPNDANVQTDLGVMYRRDGQPEKAVAAFEKASAIDPSHEPSRFNKGIVLMHDLNDREGARKAWEELVAMNPQARATNGTLVKDLIKDLN